MKPVTKIDRRFDEATHRGAGAASVDPVCGMTVDPNSAAGRARCPSVARTMVVTNNGRTSDGAPPLPIQCRSTNRSARFSWAQDHADDPRGEAQPPPDLHPAREHAV